MKFGIALALPLVMGTLSLSSVSTNAYAVNSNINGTVCKNYNAAQALDIDYFGYGTRNVNADVRQVICPIVRSPTSTNNVELWVYSTLLAGASGSCLLLSYDFDGSLLGSLPFSMGGPAHVTVPGTFWSTASVLCYLPGGGRGIINTIDVVQ